MDFVPATYALGSVEVFNLIAALLKRLGGEVTLKPEELVFTADDTLVYRVEEGVRTLRCVPAPTEDEITAALKAISVDPTCTDDTRCDLMRQLLKIKGGA